MNEFLVGIIDGLYGFVGNYGVAVMIFTVIIRIIILPFDYKSRVSMRKTTKIQPKIAEIQKRYANDKETASRKMNELYKKERVNPLSSCLPMLLTYPILIWMFNAMRQVANEHLAMQALTILQNPEALPAMDGFLWIKNIFMPDSPFSGMLPDLNMLRQVTADVWQKVLTPELMTTLSSQYSALAELTVSSFSGDTLATSITALSGALNTTAVYAQYSGASAWSFNLLITTLTIMKSWNGLFLLPLLSAGSQYLMTKLLGNNNAAATPEMEQQQQSMKMMNWFFPLFSLWICAQYNGMFALYWVTSNLVAMGETFAINKYLDNKEQKAITTGGEVK